MLFRSVGSRQPDTWNDGLVSKPSQFYNLRRKTLRIQLVEVYFVMIRKIWSLTNRTLYVAFYTPANTPLSNGCRLVRANETAELRVPCVAFIDASSGSSPGVTDSGLIQCLQF